MPKTERLFDDNPYLKSFKAKVTNIKDNEVELDKTAFYPESGGQAGDIGLIDGFKVVDTRKNNEKIIHILKSVPRFSIGDKVDCEINWDRRYLIMRLHSAAHIMEHFLWQQLGYIERIGSYVDENKDRADYTYEGRLPPDEIKKVEEETNVFLGEGHEIRIEPDPNQREFRIWKCAGIEMPCGGTHVKNTKEIGRIGLKRKNPGKGKERVETSLTS